MKVLEWIGAGAVVVGGIFGLAFIAPLVGILLGLFTGWVVKIVCGGLITDGLNLIFNTTRFSPDQLPMICATLGLFGSYFKSHQTNSSK